MFLWQIDPWIPEACFYDQRANCAAVWDIVTKRGILACCNAAHTPPATPINSTQATDARSRIRRKSGKAGGLNSPCSRPRQSAVKTLLAAVALRWPGAVCCAGPVCPGSFRSKAAYLGVPQSEIPSGLADVFTPQPYALFLKNMLLFTSRVTQISGMWYQVARGAANFVFFTGH